MKKKIVTISEDNLDEISGGDSNGSLSSGRKMFETTCANCGGIALVPFEPKNDWPVYCTECWNNVRENNPHRF